MELLYRVEDDVLLIFLQSESLDAKDAPEFKQQVIDLIEETHAQSIIIDLEPLKFIDSSGLGSFLAILRSVSSRGGELKLCSMNRIVHKMFELVSMNKIFGIYDTLNEAKQALKEL